MATNADREVSWKFRGTNELSGPALEAAQALTKLRDKIADDTKALRDLNTQMSNLKIGKKLQGENLVALDAFKTLKKSIEDRKLSISNAQTELIKMGGHIKDAVPPQGIARFKELAEAAREAGGPVGGVGRAFEFVAKALKTPLGMFVAIAVAITAVTAVTYKLIRALHDYATAQANARRSELLRLEGLGRMRTLTSMYLGVHDQSGTEIQKTVDKLSGSFAIGRDKLVEYAAQLHNLNMRGKNFDAAMEGMAIRFSTQGEASAQQFAGWASYYNYAGRAVENLTAKERTRLGGLAKLKMLDADVQAQKLDESLARIGASVDVEPLLRAKAAFNDIFKAGSASGEYMAQIWHRIAQPIQNLATWGWAVLRHFFLQTILAALEVEVAFRKVFNGILRIVISSGLGKVWGILRAGLDTYKSVVGTIGSLFAKVAKVGGIVVLAAVFGAIALAGFVVVGALTIVVSLVGLLFKGVGKLWNWLKSVDWKKLGVSFVDLGVSLVHGLLHGIATALQTAITAVTKMGVKIWQALKSTLKSASPSRLFAELGTTIPLGVALGITSATPSATQAMDRSGHAVIAAGAQSLTPRSPVMRPAALAQPAAAAGGGGGKSVTINVGGITITASGNDARDMASDVGVELTRVLEALALQMGGGADGSDEPA